MMLLSFILLQYSRSRRPLISKQLISRSSQESSDYESSIQLENSYNDLEAQSGPSNQSSVSQYPTQTPRTRRQQPAIPRKRSLERQVGFEHAETDSGGSSNTAKTSGRSKLIQPDPQVPISQQKKLPQISQFMHKVYTFMYLRGNILTKIFRWYIDTSYTFIYISHRKPKLNEDSKEPYLK